MTLTAALLAGCSEGDPLVTLTESAGGADAAARTAAADSGTLAPVPIAFSAYVNRSATRADALARLTSATRAAYDAGPLPGVPTGFAVFAYSTGPTAYADYRTRGATPARYPNLMYNEHIVRDTTTRQWVYASSAERYFWPVTADSLLSFFAYAPYDAATEASPLIVPSAADYNGDATHYSDPYVTFTLRPDSVIDLLWATTLNHHADSVATSEPTAVYGLPADSFDDPCAAQSGGSVATEATEATIASWSRPAYPVPADLSSLPTKGLVILHFKHALAKIGPLSAVLDVAPGATLDNTRVTINSITLSSDSAATTALLNLVTGVWSAHRTAGWLCSGGAAAPPTSAASSSPSPLLYRPTLSPAVAEPAAFTAPLCTPERFGELPAGVTTAPQVVTTSDNQHPMLLIPGTCPPINIALDYTVRSYDPKLADKYTEVRQCVTKQLQLLTPLLLNHRYEILLHIALDDVRFTATVDSWDGAPGGSTPDTPTPIEVPTITNNVSHVYLPANVK